MFQVSCFWFQRFPASSFLLAVTGQIQGFRVSESFNVSGFLFLVSEVSCFVVPPRSDGADSGFQGYRGLKGFNVSRVSMFQEFYKHCGEV